MHPFFISSFPQVQFYGISPTCTYILQGSVHLSIACDFSPQQVPIKLTCIFPTKNTILNLIQGPHAPNQNRDSLLLARGKGQVIYNGRPIKITPEFSMETLKAHGPQLMFCRLKKTMEASPDYYTQSNCQSLQMKKLAFHDKVDNVDTICTHKSIPTEGARRKF